METHAPSLDRLLERLGSDWHLTQKAAARQAGTLSHEQLEQILILAAAYRQGRQQRELARVFCIPAWISLICATMYACHIPKMGVEFVGLFGMMPFLLALAMLGRGQDAYPVVLDICVQTQNPRFLGAALTRRYMLERAPSTMSGGVNLVRLEQMEATRAALTVMLKQIDEAHAPLLTHDQHTSLLHLLDQEGTLSAFWNLAEQENSDAKLLLAVLHALPLIGQESALPRLTHLTAKIDLPSAIYNAAKECHSQLQQRLAEARQAQSLLRPSDSSTITLPDTLLRPANDSGSTMPEQLLRPSVDSE